MRQLLPEPGRPLPDRVALEEAYAAPAGDWLRANFVVSLDGAIEVGGRSQPLSGPADMDVYATLRALSDVVLVGASTVRREQYGPAKVKSEATERRRARGQAPIPPIAVVTASADLDGGAPLFAGEVSGGGPAGRPIVLTVDAAPPERRKRLAEAADVVVCGEETVDMQVAVAALRARGLSHVVCEGGPTLFASVLHAGLVDELCLTHAPILAGAGHKLLVAPSRPGPATAATAGASPGGEMAPWRLSFLAEGDGLLFARYQAPPPAGQTPETHP